MNWRQRKAAWSSKERERRSKFEETFEKTELVALVEAGGSYVYEKERTHYTPPAKLRTKTFDWWIILPSGKEIIIEQKGFWTPENRRDECEAIAQNPQLDIRYCFQRASTPIRKGSKTTYADWCNKKGIKWSEKTIPKEWLNE
jgi:hypothetical protein